MDNRNKPHTKEHKEKIANALKGKPTWNKGIKTGLVPKTAFKKGRKPWNAGTGKSQGITRHTKIINGKKIKVSRLVWMETNNREIPEGCVIHHFDLNPRNDKPNNLIMLDDRTHKQLHQEISRRLI